MDIVQYNRERAVEYARKWAYRRNPDYYNFQNLGGDCTNFTSQCLFAGAGVMNYTPDIGWYYRSLRDRAAAWTGVEFFYKFLIANQEGVGKGSGPFAIEVPLWELELGDFVQLGADTGDFYHTAIVVGFRGGNRPPALPYARIPLLAAHTYDTYGRPLNGYRYSRLRCLHILGVKK